MALLSGSRAAAMALLLLACPGGAERARALAIPEPQAKAAFLHNLALFVQWPEDLPAPPGVLVIGIAGTTPVGAALRDAAGRLVNGRLLQVRDIDRGDDPRGCHILYFPSLDPHARLLLPQLDGLPIVTVGDDERFVRAGGIVRVYLADARLRFDIDLGRAERGGLKLSSKMLTLARVLRDGHVIRD